MMKIKFAYEIKDNNFKIECLEGTRRKLEKLRRLANRERLRVIDGVGLTFSFKVASSKFFKKNRYINVMEFITSDNNELIYENSNQESYVEEIKKHIKLENQKNNDIKEQFLATIDNEEKLSKAIQYDDILRVIPYPFQIKQATNLFYNKRLANFSSPGSGKTLTAMMSVIREYVDNKINNLVVIGPKSASLAWINRKEIKKFYKYSHEINLYDFTSPNRPKSIISDIRRNHQGQDNLNIIFINYHKLQVETGWFKALKKLFNQRCGLIVDECHYFKNNNSQKFAKLAILSKKASYVYFLSGTPLPHSIVEGIYLTSGMWPIHNFEEIHHHIPFTKETKKYIAKFKKTYVRIDKNKGNFIQPLTIQKIKILPNSVEKYIDTELLQAFDANDVDQAFSYSINRAILIRRMQAASSPLSLNAPLENAINEIYEEEMEQNKDNLSDLDDADAVLDITNQKDLQYENKLNKIINSSKTKGVLKKYQELTDPRFLKTLAILDELQEERVIIWNVFRDSTAKLLQIIKQHFKNQRQVCRIDGSIKDYERNLELQKIRQSHNGILIASPATIAESISLHREIDHAIYFFRNYVGSHWMQSLDRIHRLVGKNEVSRKKYAYVLTSVYQKDHYPENLKTIDHLIGENLAKKTKMQAELLDK